MAKEYFFITKFHFFTIKYDFFHKNLDKKSHFFREIALGAFVAPSPRVLITIFLVRGRTTRSLRFPRQHSLSHYERGMGQLAHFISLVALRVTANGRNPKRACVRFALARSIEPSPRVLITIFLVKQKGTHKGFLFVSRRERDSNPRSCDRLRISRPAHSTTLASLRGLHNIV